MAEVLLEQPPADGGAATAPPGAFDIAIEFVGAWTEPLRSAFLRAAERIEAAVVGDLPDAAVRSDDGATTAVDDLLIRAELPDMDGVGGAFGFSVPELLRPDTLLPATARMRFDAADAASLEERGLWDGVVLHEMLHALGFGTLWSMKGLVGEGGYTGPAAMAEYAALGGFGPVPVETEGGDGTAGLHWSEAAFGDELMTGWIAVGAPLGALTLASLSDLGYALAPRDAWAVDAALA